MNSTPIRLIFLSFVTLLGACAARGGDAPAAPAPAGLEQRIEAVLPQTNPDVLYYVGAAELSGQRERFDLAAELYAKAAELSDDPQIAAQALKTAAYANNEALTLRGAERWLELEPNHPEPHRVSALLYLRRGDAEAAWTHLAVILDREPSLERWQAIVKMLARSCETTMLVTPRVSLSSRMRVSTRRALTGSRLVVGSSNRT